MRFTRDRTIIDKGKTVFRRVFVFVALLLVASTTASAQDWARKMFIDFDHDFGTVARAAKAEHVFEITNRYKEDIHIAGVRASCGCATPTIQKQTLRTWEKGGIHVRYNTKSFIGKRGATITVVIDRPYYAEVQLKVGGYIRSDVVLNPPSVNFNQVDAGETSNQLVAITYAGRSDWRITDIRSANENLEVSLNETQRGNGRVGYNMSVRLKDTAPAGFLNDQMILVTNDGRRQQIPIHVEGSIVPSLTVSPASLSLGVVNPGERVTKKIVVRGKKPFKITSIRCEDGCFEIEPPSETKRMHIVPVTFTAADTAGTVAQKIEITTDSGNAASCMATATVRQPAVETEDNIQ